MGQKVGPAVVGHGGLEILHALMQLARALVLVQIGQHLDQRQKTIVVAATAQPVVGESQQMHVGDHHRHRLQQPLGVVVPLLDSLPGFVPRKPLQTSKGLLAGVDAAGLLGRFV